MSSSGVDFCMAIRGRYPGMTRIVMTNAPQGRSWTPAATVSSTAMW